MTSSNDLLGVLIGLSVIWTCCCLFDAAATRWGLLPVAGLIFAALWLLCRLAEWDERRWRRREAARRAALAAP